MVHWSVLLLQTRFRNHSSHILSGNYTLLRFLKTNNSEYRQDSKSKTPLLAAIKISDFPIFHLWHIRKKLCKTDLLGLFIKNAKRNFLRLWLTRRKLFKWKNCSPVDLILDKKLYTIIYFNSEKFLCSWVFPFWQFSFWFFHKLVVVLFRISRSGKPVKKLQSWISVVLVSNWSMSQTLRDCNKFL